MKPGPAAIAVFSKLERCAPKSSAGAV